jgi:hypothetical protein
MIVTRPIDGANTWKKHAFVLKGWGVRSGDRVVQEGAQLDDIGRFPAPVVGILIGGSFSSARMM